MKQEQFNHKFTKENHPFLKGKQKFAAIAKDQRSNYIQKMMEIKQDPNPPPVIFKKDYPTFGKFTYQNYQLHYYSLEQTDSPQAIFVYVHGMNAHGGGSGYLASIIAENNSGINIYAFDQMNFGQSEGPFRGEVGSFQDSVSQTEAFVDFILGKLKSKPKVFLGGGSYGGSIVFKSCLNRPQKYSGAIFLAPAIRNLAEVSPVMKRIGKMVGFICPRIRLQKDKYDSGTKYNQTQRITSDPYVYNDGLVPGSVRTILNAMDEVSQTFKQFSTPYILFQAGVDKLVDPFAPLDLEAQCSAKDKTTIYCEKMWHAVLAEDEIQGIAYITAQWLKERV